MISRILLVALLALGLSQSARADSKADARRYFQRGMSLISAGRYDEGIAELEKAYDTRPHPNVLFNIAKAYASKGSLGRAINYFERYLAFDPPDAPAVQAEIDRLRQRRELRRLVARGMRAVEAGRPLEGAALLRRAYRRRPHPNILFNIGRAYEEAGADSEAIDAFERYLATNPDDADEVRARIEALREAQAAPVVAAPSPSPPRARTRRRETPPATPEPAEPPTLSEAQLEALTERLAQRIATELEARRAFAPPRVELETEADPEALVDGDLDPPIADDEAESALEAKTGEVYEDVVITASRRAESPLDAPNAVTILTSEDIRLSGARTLPDLLRRVPGVDVMAMSYSDFNVAIRGFNRRIANKILVLIDGQTAYQDFLGLTLWRDFTIDLRDIERVEIVRGPGSAIYGAYAFTGIINIITKSPRDIRGGQAYAAGGNGDRVEAAFQYGDVRGPVGFRISGGYDRADKFDNEFDPESPDISTNLDDIEESREVVRTDGQNE